MGLDIMTQSLSYSEMSSTEGLVFIFLIGFFDFIVFEVEDLGFFDFEDLWDFDTLEGELILIGESLIGDGFDDTDSLRFLS